MYVCTAQAGALPLQVRFVRVLVWSCGVDVKKHVVLCSPSTVLRVYMSRLHVAVAFPPHRFANCGIADS